MSKVVLRYESDIRVEVSSVCGKNLQDLRRDKRAVLDLSAAGFGDFTDSIRAIDVDQGAQVLCFGLTTGSFDLLLRESLSTSVTEALRSEDLYQICPVGRKFVDVLADFINCKLRVVDGSQRGQNARARQHTTIERCPKISVDGRPNTLDGCETTHRCDVSILHCIAQGLGLRGISSYFPVQNRGLD